MDRLIPGPTGFGPWIFVLYEDWWYVVDFRVVNGNGNVFEDCKILGIAADLTQE